MLNASPFEVMFEKEDNGLGSQCLTFIHGLCINIDPHEFPHVYQVGDEVVHKELGDIMERAATTASSLEAEQDSGSGPRCQYTILGYVNAQARFEITFKQSIDPPLSRGYTLGSREDSMTLIGIDGILLKLVLPVFVSAVKHMLMLPVQVSAVEVNPIIYTSCIEQFWATAKVQTINGVRQLQALVDKTRVIVTESNIRRDLHLDDAEVEKKQPSKKAQRQEEEVPQYKTEHEESIPTPFNDPQPSAKGAQAKEIAALKNRIQRLERKKISRPTGLKRLRKVGMSKRVESSEDQESLGAPEDASKQGRSIED
ncbi:hypothetical protein Tco_1327918, partial [Tanacetum coccineum]